MDMLSLKQISICLFPSHEAHTCSFPSTVPHMYDMSHAFHPTNEICRAQHQSAVGSKSTQRGTHRRYY